MMYKNISNQIKKDGCLLGVFVDDPEFLLIIDGVFGRMGKEHREELPEMFIFDVNTCEELPFILRRNVGLSSQGLKKYPKAAQTGCVVTALALTTWLNKDNTMCDPPRDLTEIFEIAKRWGFGKEIAAAKKATDLNIEYMILDR